MYFMDLKLIAPLKRLNLIVKITSFLSIFNAKNAIAFEATRGIGKVIWALLFLKLRGKWSIKIVLWPR